MKTRLLLIITLVVGLFFGVVSAWRYFDTAQFGSLLPDGGSKPAAILLLVLAVIFQTGGHLLRSKKHAMLLQQIRPLPFREVFKGQMIGFLFNALLPLRVGELIRAHYIGKGVRISRSAVFATILFERAVDLLAILALGIIIVALSGFSVGHAFSATLIGMFAVLILLTVILWLARMQNKHLLHLVYITTEYFNEHLKNRFRLMGWSFIFGLKTVLNRAVMPAYIGVSVMMWLSYLVSMYAVYLLVFDHASSFIQASTAPYIAASTPIGPAYLVSFEKVLRSICLSIDLPGAYTVLFAVLTWLVFILPSVLLGAIFVLWRQTVSATPLLSSVEVMKNKLYRDTDISAEFGSFLDTYFRGIELNRILNDQEVASNFTVIKTFKGGSNALTLLAWQDDKMIVKKITLHQYADKLAAQYQWLKEREKFKQITKALSEEKGDDHYAINLEYRDDFVTFFDFIHSAGPKDSWKILHTVTRFMSKEVYKPVTVRNQARKLDEYIETKVIGKVRDAANTSKSISQAFGQKQLIVNEQKLHNFNTVIRKIQQNKQAMADLRNFAESPIHGDLTIDNIIVQPTSHEYLLLDPNNENTISDPVTDYGKLYQSLHSGYEFLVLVPQAALLGNRIVFEEKKSVQYDALYKQMDAHLKKILPKSQYRSILFHEAVHYCRMLTYRVHINPESAVAFYGIAVRLFNEFLAQYEN